MKAIPNFAPILLHWFDQHGRKNLPWQKNKTPYRVWVSEIMLQQTQVTTVIPYFERFMQRFPNIDALANASLDDVLHLWAGLGYYSRARNLHRSANLIVQQYQGELPNKLADLIQLPGIGESTAGAILAIAFQQPATILDGNVKRVLARLHAVATPITDKQTLTLLWQIAKQYSPKKRIADYTQAMMDLGATLCTRHKPQCTICPFVKSCSAYQQKVVASIPAKKKAAPIPVHQRIFLLLTRDNTVLLQKRPANGIWGGLWSFPEIKTDEDQIKIRQIWQKYAHKSLPPNQLPLMRHTFSHFHLDILPVHIPLQGLKTKMMDDQAEIWYNLDQPEAIGLPKPVQSLVKVLYDTNHSLHQTKKRRRRISATTAPR